MMWIRTDRGELVNMCQLDFIHVVEVYRDGSRWEVQASTPGEVESYFTLCTCADEASAKEYVSRLWKQLQTEGVAL
jgi:hypothetical protein